MKMHRLCHLRWPAAALLLGALLSGAELPVSSSPATLTAVDTHAHIFHRGFSPVAGARYVPNYDATEAELFQQFAAHRISHGVLVQPSFFGTDNSVLLAALRAYPARLRGIVVVSPAVAKDQLAAMATAGVVGIRLNLIGQPLPDFQRAPWPDFFNNLKQLRWLVDVQREARDLPKVVGPLLAAGLDVVVDHFGRPDPKLGVDDPGFRYLLTQAATRRLWVKLSGAYRNGPDGIGDAIADAAAPMLLRAFGPDRLLWGSDWPHTQFEHAEEYADARAQLDRWIADPVARRVVLASAPAALFRFDTAVEPLRDTVPLTP